LRLAVHHPERITALISQNGNAYVEGLSGGWNPIQVYWKDLSPEDTETLARSGRAVSASMRDPQGRYRDHAEAVKSRPGKTLPESDTYH
jgi:hypothetical protein